jgi:hypothetical protein
MDGYNYASYVFDASSSCIPNTSYIRTISSTHSSEPSWLLALLKVKTALQPQPRPGTRGSACHSVSLLLCCCSLPVETVRSRQAVVTLSLSASWLERCAIASLTKSSQFSSSNACRVSFNTGTTALSISHCAQAFVKRALKPSR